MQNKCKITLPSKEIEYLIAPLTDEEIRSVATLENPTVTGIVEMGLDDILYYGDQYFFEIISEKLVGNSMLEDIEYEPVAVLEDGDILIEVRGNASYNLEG